MSPRKKVLFAVVIVVVLLLCTEGVLRLVSAFTGTKQADPHLALPPYQNQSWAPELWSELTAAQMTIYEPYLDAGYSEFHGSYVNISADGERLTWNATSSAAGSSTTIWVLGGSTAFGVGARDDYSMPSDLSRLLAAKGYDVTVEDFGMPGYTSTQDLLKLMLMLRAGARPDYVISYDGFGDMQSAYDAGAPGLPSNVNVLMQAYGSQGFSRFWFITQSTARDAWGNLTNVCVTCKAVGNLAGLIAPSGDDTASASIGDQESTSTLATLAQQTAATYLWNQKLIDTLSQQYGFHYLAFWEPTLPMEKTTVGYEDGLTKLDPGIADSKENQFVVETVGALPTGVQNNFYNIDDALAGRTEGVYLDRSHLSEQGYEMVAERIAQIFEQRFPNK
jgi:lysophospholipase L1-like esterase